MPVSLNAVAKGRSTGLGAVVDVSPSPAKPDGLKDTGDGEREFRGHSASEVAQSDECGEDDADRGKPDGNPF